MLDLLELEHFKCFEVLRLPLGPLTLTIRCQRLR